MTTHITWDTRVARSPGAFISVPLQATQDPPPHADHLKHPLAHDVVEAMLPIYQRMSDLNLLNRMLKGKAFGHLEDVL